MIVRCVRSQRPSRRIDTVADLERDYQTVFRLPRHLRKGDEGSAAELLVDRANLLTTLTAPEMAVLVGGAAPSGPGNSQHAPMNFKPTALGRFM